MKKLLLTFVVVLATLMVALPGLAGSRNAEFTVTTLDYPGAIATYFDGINARGQAVGGYFDGTTNRAFMYEDGDFTTLPIEGVLWSFAFDVNDRGDIVGTYLSEQGEWFGFRLDRHNQFTSIQVPNAAETWVAGINNAGVIVGTYYIGDYTDDFLTRYYGFTLEDGVFAYPIAVPLPADAPSQLSFDVHEINEKGQIVGAMTNFSGYSRAVMLEKDGTAVYYDEADSAYRGINNSGQVVGSLGGVAFLNDRGEAVMIDVPGADYYATINGINSNGVMVGWYAGDTGLHGLLITR